MNKIKTILLTAIITILLVIVGFLVSKQIPKVERIVTGGAPPGGMAVSGSSSLVTLPGTTALQIFASSTCISRIIGYADTSLRLTFFDSADAPSATFGTNQNASTSVSYDSGIYGCGRWRAFNPNAAQTTFTITEFLGFQ